MDGWFRKNIRIIVVKESHTKKKKKLKMVKTCLPFTKYDYDQSLVSKEIWI